MNKINHEPTIPLSLVNVVEEKSDLQKEMARLADSLIQSESQLKIVTSISEKSRIETSIAELRRELKVLLDKEVKMKELKYAGGSANNNGRVDWVSQDQDILKRANR